MFNTRPMTVRDFLSFCFLCKKDFSRKWGTEHASGLHVHDASFGSIAAVHR